MSLSGVERSRNLRPLIIGFETGGGCGCGCGIFAFRAEETYCRRSGSEDCTDGARSSGRACCDVYSLGEFLVRVISVAALEGARKRVCSSSSASSVPARRFRSRIDVRRPAIVDCVGVDISEGVYRGDGNELVANRLLLRASRRLKARGLGFIGARVSPGRGVDDSDTPL